MGRRRAVGRARGAAVTPPCYHSPASPEGGAASTMKTLTIFAISAWLGMLSFLAAVVAPAAFGVLDRPAAGRLIAWVMPRYHWAALGLGVLGLAGLVLRRGEVAGGWIDRLPLVLVLVMLALTALSLFVLFPQ